MHNVEPVEGGGFNTDDWFIPKEELKKKNPLINLPYIVDDGVVITQSNACMEYLGTKFNLMGKTTLERGECTMLLCQAKDLRAEGDEPAAALRERRRTYLKLAADQLQADLNALHRDDGLSLTSLRCALETLDDRLAALQTHRQATAPEEGLYIPSVSVEILEETQPKAALTQLSADSNRDARAALESGYPGFQTALDQAVEEDSWAPLGEWLHAHGG